MSAAHRHLACLATVALCDLSKAENHHKTIAFRHSSNQLSEFLLPQMCQQYDDSSAQLSSARGLNDIFGYPYPCVYWLDRQRLLCALDSQDNLHNHDIYSTQAGTHDSHLRTMASDMLHTFDPSSLGDLLSMPSHVLQHSWFRGYRLDSQVSLRKHKLE